MDSAGDPIDRISALPNELLHAILAAVGEATAVMRTAVLSKRWRRVWIHAQRLKLEDTEVLVRDAATRACCFAGFVDWVLARRGDASIGCLEIRMSEEHDGTVLQERANEWLRYAARHVAIRQGLPSPALGSGTDPPNKVEFAESCRDSRPTTMIRPSCCPDTGGWRPSPWLYVITDSCTRQQRRQV